MSSMQNRRQTQADYVEFAMDQIISTAATKIARISELSQKDQVALQKRIDEIGDALFSWRVKAAEKGGHLLLNIPDGESFTNSELDLAGWALEYAKTVGISYKEAIIRILESLKRYPDQLKQYVHSAQSNVGAFGGGVSFAEASDVVLSSVEFAEAEASSLGLSIPRGYSCSKQDLEFFRSVRIFQAGSGTSFTEAAYRFGNL